MCEEKGRKQSDKTQIPKSQPSLSNGASQKRDISPTTQDLSVLTLDKSLSLQDTG